MQFMEWAPTIERVSCALDVQHPVLGVVSPASMSVASDAFGR
jgi:hypothetical protein